MNEFHKNREYFSNGNLTAEKTREELNMGLALLNKINEPIVTFFGSHKVTPENEFYQQARHTAFELGKRGYAILSGGGPGIMHAANSGAMEAGAPSIGLRAELLEEQEVTDKIFTHKLSFHFLFTRRFVMAIKSEALVFYPGGYGTLNELFDYAVHMQTNIIDTVPIICVNKKYWQGLFDWLKESPLKKDFFIDNTRAMNLMHFVDNFSDIMSLLEEGRQRKT